MRKLTVCFLFVLLLLSTSQVFANLDDTRAAINAKYGDYRLVIDNDSQLWTKAEWEASGYKKAKAAAFVHRFKRGDTNFQMEVQYSDDKPGSYVRAQRITPDCALKVKELKAYLPEIYSLVTSPKAQAFTSNEKITKNFVGKPSAVTMGVVVKLDASPDKRSSYTFIAFNIMGEGSYITDAKQINADTYIHEIVIESVGKNEADPDSSDKIKKWLKNPF